MRYNSKDSTTAVKAVCAMLFLLFIISYVYFFQHNLLEMIQFAWAEGKTHYDRVIGASVIAVTLALLSFVVSSFTKLPQRLFSLVFFPAFLFLGLMTAVTVQERSVTTSMIWLVASPLLLIFFVLFSGAAKKFQPFLVPLRSTSFLSQPWWTNVSLMVVMMLMTYGMGNTDRTLHTRLAAEHYCKMRQWDKALEQGFPQYDNDSSLTMLRALALANTNEMGERLFRYDITGGSRSLFPQRDNSTCFLLSYGYRLWQTIGVVPRDLNEPVDVILRRELRRGTVKPAAKDYLLCAYLLDKDLDNFVETLQKYYTINDSLPTHYREALVLYGRKYNKNVAVTLTDGEVDDDGQEDGRIFRDAAMEADYDDFLAIVRKNRNPLLRHSALRDAYFGTYWYYYFRQANS